MRLGTRVVLLSPALLWVAGVAASTAPKAAPLLQDSYPTEPYPTDTYPTDPCALKSYDQKCCNVLDGHGGESKHLCNKNQNCCGQGCCPKSWTCKKGKCQRPKSPTKFTATETLPCYGCSSTSSTSSECTDTTYTFTGPSSTEGTTAAPSSTPDSTGVPSPTDTSTKDSTSAFPTGPSSPGDPSSTSPTSSTSRSQTSDSSGTDSVPPTSTSQTVPSTNSNGQTIVTSSGATFVIPTGLTTPVVITSGDQTLTFTPSLSSGSSSGSPTTSNTGPPQTTNSNGQTIITSSGAKFTIPTGISSVTVVTSGDQTLTFTPSPTTGPSGTETTSVPTSPPETSVSTNSNGETVITNSEATFTIPTGISTPITLTSSGQTLTFTPSASTTPPSSDTTIVNSDSRTVISNTEEAVTLPTGITTRFTTTVGNETFTFVPSGLSSTLSPPSSSTDTTAPPSPTTTTNSDGQTIISDTSGVITVPTGISTPITLTNSDGEITTFTPGPITSPPSSTTSSSSTAADFMLPITTSVDEPEPTDDGAIIPCSLWFFSTCLRWDDFNIFGWHVILPPGIRPPGPPPRISIDPTAPFKVKITGTLPDWPELTIGPDHLPTYTPTSSPTSCETQTAELCATRTSYGVSNSASATITTTTQVLSTCATIFGCNVQDATATETTTGGCTSATTATNIWLSCPGTASTSCSTTSTAVTSGCSVTPTTVTCGFLTPTGIIDDPACSAPTGTFVVYPEDGADSTSVNAITTRLQTYVDNPGDIYTSTADELGILFWRLDITESQSNEIREFAGVASVNLNLPCSTNECEDPTSALVYQNAEEQLQFVSWPRKAGPEISAMHGRYYFDESNGEGIPVYILDTGVNRDHPEFARANSRIRFIHVGRDVGLSEGEPQPQDDAQTDAEGSITLGGAHGTAMLSIVAGDTIGVAKSCLPIPVRLPRRQKAGGGFRNEDWIEGLEKIRDDLEGESKNTRAVVLLAEYFTRERFVRVNLKGDRVENPATGEHYYDTYGWQLAVRRLLGDLVDKGALLVTGSGNNGNPLGLNGWPARWADPSDNAYLPSLVVAGAISSNGLEYYQRTNSDIGAGLPQICAPGLNVKAADGNRAHWGTYKVDGIPWRSWSESELNYKKSDGTSDAAAFTAGIAAYFLQLANLGLLINDDLQPVDTTPRGLKDYIIAQSWPRVARYQTKAGDIVCPGLWNTANLAQRVCPWNPNPPAALFARQEGDTCEIPLPSSSSSSSSTPSSTATSTGSPTPPPPSTTSPPSSTTSEQSSTTGSQTTSTSEAPVVNKGTCFLGDGRNPWGQCRYNVEGNDVLQVADCPEDAICPSDESTCVVVTGGPVVVVSCGGGQAPSSTSTPPPETSTSEPPPEPTTTEEPQPSPDPSTENVKCYNGGAIADRTGMINTINAFCSENAGTVLDGSDPNGVHELYIKRNVDESDGCIAFGCAGFVEIWVSVKDDCIFEIDGASSTDECGRILRRPTDECDTEGVDKKTGGTVESNCANWRIDPGDGMLGRRMVRF